MLGNCSSISRFVFNAFPGFTFNYIITDPTNSIAILQKVVEKVKQDNGAYVLARMEVANFKIGLNDINAASEIIQESQVILDSLSSVDPLIHGSFYRVCSVYHKVRAEYAPYYKNSLLYLACINEAQDLSVEDRVERAHDLCLAALLSDKIYNFGELLMHPILDSLSSTAHSWLSDLIFAFNAGDIGKYDSLSSQFHKQPLLTRNSVFLRQKLCLMALIELTFKSLGSGRCLGFETISQETRIPITEVEHLLMKALSLNLIKGKIDQVNQSIKVDWVQPRVLDRNQIKNLSVQLEGWHEKVGNIAKSVQQQVEE